VKKRKKGEGKYSQPFRIQLKRRPPVESSGLTLIGDQKKCSEKPRYYRASRKKDLKRPLQVQETGEKNKKGKDVQPKGQDRRRKKGKNKRGVSKRE